MILNIYYVRKKNLIATNNKTIQVFNFDDITKEDIKEHDPNWSELLTIHMQY